jgi:hypothetical protein
MNLTRIISDLKSELSAIDDVLLALGRLARTKGKRRGRPPLFLVRSAEGVKPATSRFTAKTRKKMAAAQKKRWAAYRKAQAKKAAEA